MKKFMALILSVCMLISFACAEDAFTEGLDRLLDSIRIGRDQLTLTATGEQPFTVSVRSEDELMDVAVETPEGTYQIQAGGNDLYFAGSGMALHVNLEELAGAVQQGIPLDPETAAELGQLLLTKLVLPFAQVDTSEKLHIAWRAEGAELLKALSEVLDVILTDEKYAPLVDQVLAFLKTASGQEVPGREQIVQAWPSLKEQMTGQEVDFHIAFSLDADRRMSDIRVSGEIGPESDLLLMDWSILSTEEKITLTGKLSERISRGESVRDYDIDIQGEVFDNIWSLDISYPYRDLHLKAEGSHEEEKGRFSVTRERFRTSVPEAQVMGAYVIDDEEFTCSFTMMDRRNGVWSVSAVVGEDIVDVKAAEITGRQGFAMKVMKDDDTLKWGSLSMRAPGEDFSVVYDGEKAVVSVNGQVITCTGEMESDHVYVVTMHPENPPEGQEAGDAHARLEYTGEEGNFTVTALLTDSDDGEVLRAELKCEPSGGIPQKIADMENLVHLTPEMIMSLVSR